MDAIMIAKHVPMNSAKKSDFAGLVKYIMGPQGKDERVGLVRITNCHSEQAEIAMLEVLNTQVQNTRATADKTYHLIVSFQSGEMPDEATLHSIEERICAGLGFGDHQRVSVVHHDTDNLHMHIAVNKIHPTRYTMHEPFNAYHTLGQLCDAIENDYGLEKDNHKANKVGSENRAFDMEHHAAVESLLGWIKRECKDKIEGAQTWDGMHQVMREHGLRIHERANGLVITAENGVSVKASSVARELSKTKLEARLGAFTVPLDAAASAKPGKRYDKQPMHSRVNTVDLHARYKAAQRFATSTRAVEWSKAVARKNRLTEDAKRNGRLKRAAIKLLRAPGIGKKLMYAATSKTLREDIAAINRQYLKERHDIYEKYHRHAWADWLRSEATAGDQEALAALRARHGATGLKGNTLGRQDGIKRPMHGAKRDSVTKKGTIIYRVGASALRDDGDKLKVSRGVDQAGLEAALRMAVERYGSCINVNGSASFKEKIAQVAVALNLSVSFYEDALERRRQQLACTVKSERSNHGNFSSNDGGVRRGHPDSSRYGGGKQSAASIQQGASHVEKRGTRNAGQTPPPGARHSLRGLSELSVVHVAGGGEVLLPGHVPGHVEYQRTKPDHGVRRDIHRPGRLSGKSNVGRVGAAPPPASKDRLRQLSELDAIVINNTVERPLAASSAPAIGGLSNPSLVQAAADKYIAEREQKRARGLHIQKHVPYIFINDGRAEFAGIREIEGQALALLKLGEEIMVLPVDNATAKRLRRVAVGQRVDLTAKGTIKTKGRSR